MFCVNTKVSESDVVVDDAIDRLDMSASNQLRMGEVTRKELTPQIIETYTEELS